jgi:hypothetical protein
MHGSQKHRWDDSFGGQKRENLRQGFDRGKKREIAAKFQEICSPRHFANVSNVLGNAFKNRQASSYVEQPPAANNENWRDAAISCQPVIGADMLR